MSARGLLPDPAGFLARHWQREPLLIRAAVADFHPPVSAEELAGLAMEEEVESRIVVRRDASWELQHGPFAADAFNFSDPWTLLVQGVDQLLPEVAELRRLVNGPPTWRLDDIMVSYASDGGGVGPHFDRYDVFLLQGEGERLWRLGQRCDEHSALLPHDHLCLLEHFDCQAEYRLQCGDVLYVPPGVAHWGISVGDSTCFSIGFRAPRLADLLSRWTDVRLEGLRDHQLLGDAGRPNARRPNARRPNARRPNARRPGEIDRADVDNAVEQLRALLCADSDPLWFGEVVTETEPVNPDRDLLERLLLQLSAPGAQVAQAAEARLAWQQLSDDTLRVFVNGHSQCAPAALAEVLGALCDGQVVPVSAILERHADAAGVLEFMTAMGGLDVD